MLSYNRHRGFNIRYLIKIIRMRSTCTHLRLLSVVIGISFMFNLLFMIQFFQYSSSFEIIQMVRNSKSDDFNTDIISTVERSARALERLKNLLASVTSPGEEPWIWMPTDEYPSVPYQPSSLLNQSIPKILYKITDLPQSVIKEVNRVCKRLKQASRIGGDIWCKLFNKSYTDTLATTTAILDDSSTYVITGDIDLMWLRDSSAQVHQYLSLWKDPNIQRIIEGLIYLQIRFIYSDPYGSAFRLTLRPNPPSDDSLAPQHTRKGRNLRVAMHNYELDSLCYHLRLSYSWWKQSQRTMIFNHQWLIAVKIIIQLMITEQHHSQISPYRYTELPNNYQGSLVAYTGMTWSAFRPSDDQTKYGYLIPSNMMACVSLEQLIEMIQKLYPKEIQLLRQIAQLRADILSGINTYGVVHHEKYGQIYAYETDGISQYLLLDDANVPSLLSTSYLGFKTPYDPMNKILQSTRQFILSNDNSLFFQGKFAYGIGSEHTTKQFVWPMSIIIEGLTLMLDNHTKYDLDSVWKRLELSHVETFSMHESFNVDDPKQFTRRWFAWVDSLFAELILTHLDSLEDWLHSRRNI